MRGELTRERGLGRALVGLLRTGLLIYAGLLLLLAACQRRLIYLPSREGEQSLTERASVTGWSPWLDSAGARIGWKGRDGRGGGEAGNRIVVFHGNAGHALHRLYFRRGLEGVRDGSAWQVFVFEYPGYGARAGSPGQEAFLEAAGEALRSLLREDERPVFLLGESLGAGVACKLAADHPDEIAGLVLTTPFPSLADVASRHYPFVPVRLILRDRWDNVSALEEYRGPVAVLVAERDEIVPADLGRALYESYQGPKRLWSQDGARHNTIDYREGSPWWEELTDFLLEGERSGAR